MIRRRQFFICIVYCPFINYVPETSQRLYCCLQWKLNIDEAPAFTPDFIVLTNMFCLQNNLNWIINQKAERPLSFSTSLVWAPDVRDHVLMLTIHAKSAPSFIHYWKQMLRGRFRHGHRDWCITCIEVTWHCLSGKKSRDRNTKSYLLFDQSFASIQAITFTEDGFCWTCVELESFLIIPDRFNICWLKDHSISTVMFSWSRNLSRAEMFQLL